IYDYAEIELVDGPDNQLVGKLFNREAEVIVLTRQFTNEESKFFEAREFRPRIAQFATDAVALIANRNNPDSTMTVDDIIQIMRGNYAAGVEERLFLDKANARAGP